MEKQLSFSRTTYKNGAEAVGVMDGCGVKVMVGVSDGVGVGWVGVTVAVMVGVGVFVLNSCMVGFPSLVSQMIRTNRPMTTNNTARPPIKNGPNCWRLR